MRLYCLSGDPNYPCFVLAAKGCTIMLDCSLNMKTVQHFIPQMLVVNQRFESMPNYRSPNGTTYENIKEYNNRVYLNSTLEFSIPQFNLINIEDLDAVLISHPNFMLALPYLTRLKGFRADIYCTEPVMHFGRMLMEELTHSVKNNQSVILNNQKEKQNQANSNDFLSKFSLFRTLAHLSLNLTNKETEMDLDNDAPPNKQAKIQQDHQSESNDLEDLTESNGLANQKQNYNLFAQLLNITEAHLKPLNWKYLYSKEEVDLCISKIKLIDFNQRVSIYGALTIQPKSSGHSIGSCNWTIESDCDNISYLSKSSLLNTHAKLFNQLFLKQQIIDCLVLSGLNQAQMHEPEQMILEFCKACVHTIKNQGNVLVPIQPMGKIYDLIEFLYRYLADASLPNIPIYFMSHVAEQSLAYSNIFAEWLNESKQNLVYAAESPFQHGELFKTGFLKVYPGINSKFNDEFHQPCILFVSHPSLRFGEACHFVDLWKNCPNNSFIFTDPEFYYIDALAPYQPIYAKYYYFPIDTSLTSNHVHKLLKEPKHITQLISSNQYKYPAEHDQNTSKIDSTKLSPKTELNFYSQNDILKLILKRKYENCDIEADLASIIIPSKKNNFLSETSLNNVSFATFNAQLITKNNHHVLKAAPRTIPLTRRDRINESNLKKYTYGKINVDKFLGLLKQCGLAQAKLIGKSLSEENSGLSMTSVDKDTCLIDDASTTGQTVKTYIEIDSTNKIELELSVNKINVLCDNEDYRVKIKDCLLKCLKTL